MLQVLGVEQDIRLVNHGKTNMYYFSMCCKTKKKGHGTIISENNILELAINGGAEDCSSNGLHHEVIIKKDSFYFSKLFMYYYTSTAHIRLEAVVIL